MRFVADADDACCARCRCKSQRERNHQRRMQNPRPPMLSQTVDARACPLFLLLHTLFSCTVVYGVFNGLVAAAGAVPRMRTIPPGRYGLPEDTLAAVGRK